MITLKLLKHFNVCKDDIDFVTRNKLIGLSLKSVKYLEGKHEFLNWLKGYNNIIVDCYGNVIQSTDCIRRISYSVYDSANNIIQHISVFECGGGGGRLEFFKYDLNNNLIEHSMCGGTITSNMVETMQYDSDNNKILHTSYGGNKSRFQYDSNNNLIEYSEIGGRLYWKYDLNSNVIEHTDYEGYAELFQYDSNNNLIQHIGRYHTERFDYDSNNRKTMHSTSCSSVDAFWEYDTIGNITKYTNHSGVVINYTYTYYDNGQLKTLID